MGLAELFLIGVGLSMDAFAVSICKGLGMRKLNPRHAAVIAAFFGGFQALMPLIGWLLGRQFERYIVEIDHWVAFGLLSFIGIKMIVDSFKTEDGEADCAAERLDIKGLFVLAVATSIDALAVGISFAFLQVSITRAIVIIGVTTFALSLVGVWVGNKFGAKYQNKAALLGGVILIGIGIKILLEHLGILAF